MEVRKSCFFFFPISPLTLFVRIAGHQFSLSVFLFSREKAEDSVDLFNPSGYGTFPKIRPLIVADTLKTSIT